MRRALFFLFLLPFATACSAADDPEPPTPPTAQPAPVSEPAPVNETPEKPEIFTYRVINEFPHPENNFTQGLFIHDGVLYETTGHIGQSRLIRHDVLGSAEPKEVPLPGRVFGEGSVAVGERIISLTWRAGIGHVHNLQTLEVMDRFAIDGEGWGLTYDGTRLIMSDGTARLRFLDPDSFEEQGAVTVRIDGKPLYKLNELEYIDGLVWANIWQEEAIVKIDPATGAVRAVIDMRGLMPVGMNPRDDVLNGIAWDPAAERLFVTGKNWPKLFEIELVPAG